MSKIGILELLESGVLIEDQIGELAEWAKETATPGQTIGATSEDTSFTHYFKCLTVSGGRFLYLGTTDSFKKYREGGLQ